MRKAITTSVFVLVAVMMAAAPTAAGRMWCRADPIISFNGTNVQVWVELPSEYEYLVNGPILFEVTTPKGVASEVLFTDAGFNGFGEEVRFDTKWGRGTDAQPYGAFAVEFRVSVPLDEQQLQKDFGQVGASVPVRLRIVAADGSEMVVGGSASTATISVAVRSQ
jgi:hypothetical protein